MGVKKYLSQFKTLKKAVEFSRHFVKKDPSFYFFSPALARRRAIKTEAAPANPPSLKDVLKCAGGCEMILRENLLAVPLRHGEQMDYSGGLISQVSLTLVDEAVHIRSDGKQLIFCQELPTQKLEQMDVKALPEITALVMYAGLLYQHFGHFLLESLGRLWAYKKVQHLDPYVLFLLAYDPPDYLETRNFAYQVFKGFNIPLRKIIFVKDPTRIRAAIIPSQKYGYGHCLRPGPEFLDFVRSFSFPKNHPAGFSGAKNIYVSRSRLNAGAGKAVGEIYFEEYLRENGYLIFFPENFTLYEQLTVYSEAENLLFSDGSAIHACILLPSLKAKVAVIARRKDKDYDLSKILDQFKGYKQSALWIDEVTSQYQFGMDSWQSLALVDWVKVSKKLVQAGFTRTVMSAVPEEQMLETLRADIEMHLQAISNEPRFIDYMLKARESDVFKPVSVMR